MTFVSFSEVLLFRIFFVLVRKIALRLSSLLTQWKNMTEICPSVIKLAKNRTLMITLTLKNISKKPPELHEHVADCTCHITMDYDFFA